MRRFWFGVFALGAMTSFLATSVVLSQPGPGGRPGAGGMREPGGGPGNGPGTGQAAPVADVSWTDVQVHLRAGIARNFDAVIESALTETAPLHRKTLVLVPPPFPSDTAN